MPLPLVPTAAVAVRYAALGLAVYGALRARERARRDQRAEDAMDELGEGPAYRRDPDGLRGAWRFQRVIRAGQAGPGIEIDFAGLARLRLRRV